MRVFAVKTIRAITRWFRETNDPDADTKWTVHNNLANLYDNYTNTNNTLYEIYDH